MSRETDLAWAAGIVDGEGCISLHTVKSQQGLCYVLRLTVTNTSVLMLTRLQEIFGGGSIHPKTRYSEKHRQGWYWQVCSKKAERAIRLIEPYLVNKREEARVGLYSRELMQQHGENRGNPNAEELAWLKTRLSDLKSDSAPS